MSEPEKEREMWPFLGAMFLGYTLMVVGKMDKEKTNEPMFIAVYFLTAMLTLAAVAVDMHLQHIIRLLSEVR